MRSTDEQLHEIMKRAENIQEKNAIKRNLRACIMASCISAVLLIIACFYIPRLSVKQEDAGLQRYGSMLLSTPYMGYVVVGVLAFILGICIALICVQRQKLKDKEKVQK
ncbi:MAG: hypothetical protein K6C35_05310 [Eubacterium sp.]|nr:hypothetical protein [Eubacterium sp.]